MRALHSHVAKCQMGWVTDCYFARPKLMRQLEPRPLTGQRSHCSERRLATDDAGCNSHAMWIDQIRHWPVSRPQLLELGPRPADAGH